MERTPKSSTIPPAQITEEQWEQAAVVQAEILELMKRLVGDGFDYRIVLTGASTALADLVMSICGAGEVPVHFARMAAFTMHLDPTQRRQ